MDNKSEAKGGNNILPSARVQGLLVQSIDTLEAILSDQEISAQERAMVALKILEMTGLFSEKNHHLITTLISDAQRVQSTFLSANYVEIKNFLSPEANQKAIEEAIQKRSQYIESNTTTKADKYRYSHVLFSRKIPELSALIQRQITETLPEVLTQLNFCPFKISEIELQLTAHNDGCYYRIHNDAGSKKTANRQITYVYYFHQEPKAFSGGELRIYDTEIKGGTVITHQNFKTITPTNNSIIFFNSRCRHEVMPVVCPSKAFEHSRFTINGWIRKLAFVPNQLMSPTSGDIKEFM